MSFELLENLLKFHRNNPFITTKHQTTTYSEALKSISILLNQLSPCEEKIVGIITPSGPLLKDFIILLLSLLKLNAKVFVLSPKEPPKKIISQLNKINANYLVAFYSSSFYNTLNYELQSLPTPPTSLKFFELSLPYQTNARFTILSSENPNILSNQSTIIVPTSGSMGTPKNVVLSLQNFLMNAQYSNQNIKFTENDTWLLSLPVFHVSGLSIIFRAIVGGAKIFIPDDIHTPYNDNFPDVITHISMVNTILWRVLNSPSPSLKEKMKRLKAILLGGGPIPGELVKTAYELGWRLYTTYGMTEMASQITTTLEDDSLEHLLTSGKPLIPNSVKLSNNGIIYVNGPTRFIAYLENGKLKTPFDHEGWFETGDIGKWTEDGYLCILGRKDNMFVSAGENIFPEEIESCILESGCAQKAIIIPEEDQEYGLIPVAYIELERNKTEQDLINFLKTKLPGIKIPKKFYPFPEQLKVSNLKISRKALIDYINARKKGLI